MVVVTFLNVATSNEKITDKNITFFMRRSKFSFMFAMVLAMVLGACSNVTSMMGSGFESDPKSKITTRVVKVSNINSLQTHTGVKVDYVNGSSNTVTVKAPEDLQDKIAVSVSGSTIDLKYTENVRKGKDRVSITVETPDVSRFSSTSGSVIAICKNYTPSVDEVSLDVSSGSVINCSGMKAAVIGLSASSGGVLNVNVIAESVACDVSSGGVIEISGSSDAASMEVSSGAVISAANLKVRTGEVSASSGGTVSCNIENITNRKASSGGSILNR